MKINKTIYAALAVLFTCLGINARAQNSLFTIEHEKVHVLYTYIDNPIKVTGTAKFDSLAIEGGVKGSVTKGDNPNSYVIRLLNWTTNSKKTIKLNVYSNGKVVDSREYRVKVLPSPRTIIGNHLDGDSLTKQEISELISIECVESDFVFDGKKEVTGFVIDKISKKGKTTSLEIKGESISTETRAWLLDTEPGTKIVFRDLRADVLGRIVPLQSVHFIVK